MNRNPITRRTGALLVAVWIVLVLSVNTGWSQIGNPATTAILPQIPVGSFDGGLTRYSTVIEIVNANPISVTLSGNFFREDGTPLNLALSTNLSNLPTIINGTLPTVVLDPNKIIVISAGTTTATTPAIGVVTWARILASASLSISTFLELRDARTNVLLSRVGLPASPANMIKFAIPRIRNVASGLDLGFALVNTGFNAVTLSATLFDAAGSTLAVRNFTIQGNSHISRFAEEFFGVTTQTTGTTFQFIVFDTVNAPQLAATGIEFEGFIQSNVPVDVLR